jgi:MSHA pilin protein MshD
LSIKSQRGLSLIEILVFIVIVSVGLTGMLSTFQATLMRSADPLIQKQMLAIAESMMEEVQGHDFAPGEDSYVPSSKACTAFRSERELYDDLDDYDGVMDCPVYSLADSSAPVSGLEQYRLSVAVVADSGLNGLSSASAKKIIVTVWQTGLQADQSLTLEGWRTSYGP